MASAAQATLDVECIPAHAADAVGAGAPEVRHGTDNWLRARGARCHGTGLAVSGTVQVVHATSSVTLRIGEFGHGTEAKVRLVRAPAHAVNVRSIRVPIRTHKVLTAVAGTPQLRDQPSLLVRVGPGYQGPFARWIGGAAIPPALLIVDNRTDALLRGVRTWNHKTSNLARLAFIPSHTTNSRVIPLQGRGHDTDALLHGPWILPSYVDALKWGTLVRTHNTHVQSCFIYTGFHTTDAARLRVRTWAHKTDIVPVVWREASHGADMLLLKVPGGIHLTNTLVASVRARNHKTTALTVRRPISGRWATPRVGTRLPVQMASKDRQWTNNRYPVAFLLVGHDRIAPVLGATPVVKLLKPGGGWVNAAGDVTELENGWYQLEGHPTDRSVIGEILLMATDPAAETAFTKFDIVAPDTYDGITLVPAERQALADVTLTRAFVSVASIPARCVIQAVRALWYWKAAPDSPLLIKIDDGTTAWKATVVTDPTIQPIRGMDPLGP